MDHPAAAAPLADLELELPDLPPSPAAATGRRQDRERVVTHSSAGVAAATTAPDGSWDERFRRMYEVHAPDGVRSLPVLLAACRGREAAMMDALVSKFGPEPGAAGTRRASPTPPDAFAAADREWKQARGFLRLGSATTDVAGPSSKAKSHHRPSLQTLDPNTLPGQSAPASTVGHGVRMLPLDTPPSVSASVPARVASGVDTAGGIDIDVATHPGVPGVSNAVSVGGLSVSDASLGSLDGDATRNGGGLHAHAAHNASTVSAVSLPQPAPPTSRAETHRPHGTTGGAVHGEEDEGAGFTSAPVSCAQEGAAMAPRGSAEYSNDTQPPHYGHHGHAPPSLDLRDVLLALRARAEQLAGIDLPPMDARPAARAAPTDARSSAQVSPPRQRPQVRQDHHQHYHSASPTTDPHVQLQHVLLQLQRGVVGGAPQVQGGAAAARPAHVAQASCHGHADVPEVTAASPPPAPAAYGRHHHHHLPTHAVAYGYDGHHPAHAAHLPVAGATAPTRPPAASVSPARSWAGVAGGTVPSPQARPHPIPHPGPAAAPQRLGSLESLRGRAEGLLARPRGADAAATDRRPAAAAYRPPAATMMIDLGGTMTMPSRGSVSGTPAQRPPRPSDAPPADAAHTRMPPAGRLGYGADRPPTSIVPSYDLAAACAKATKYPFAVPPPAPPNGGSGDAVAKPTHAPTPVPVENTTTTPAARGHQGAAAAHEPHMRSHHGDHDRRDISPARPSAVDPGHTHPQEAAAAAAPPRLHGYGGDNAVAPPQPLPRDHARSQSLQARERRYSGSGGAVTDHSLAAAPTAGTAHGAAAATTDAPGDAGEGAAVAKPPPQRPPQPLRHAAGTPPLPRDVVSTRKAGRTRGVHRAATPTHQRRPPRQQRGYSSDEDGGGDSDVAPADGICSEDWEDAVERGGPGADPHHRHYQHPSRHHRRHHSRSGRGGRRSARGTYDYSSSECEGTREGDRYDDRRYWGGDDHHHYHRRRLASPSPMARLSSSWGSRRARAEAEVAYDDDYHYHHHTHRRHHRHPRDAGGGRVRDRHRRSPEADADEWGDADGVPLDTSRYVSPPRPVNPRSGNAGTRRTPRGARPQQAAAWGDHRADRGRDGGATVEHSPGASPPRPPRMRHPCGDGGGGPRGGPAAVATAWTPERGAPTRDGEHEHAAAATPFSPTSCFSGSTIRLDSPSPEQGGEGGHGGGARGVHEHAPGAPPFTAFDDVDDPSRATPHVSAATQHQDAQHHTRGRGVAGREGVGATAAAAAASRQLSLRKASSRRLSSPPSAACQRVPDPRSPPREDSMSIIDVDPSHAHHTRSHAEADHRHRHHRGGVTYDDDDEHDAHIPASRRASRRVSMQSLPDPRSPDGARGGGVEGSTRPVNREPSMSLMHDHARRQASSGALRPPAEAVVVLRPRASTVHATAATPDRAATAPSPAALHRSSSRGRVATPPVDHHTLPFDIPQRVESVQLRRQSLVSGMDAPHPHPHRRDSGAPPPFVSPTPSLQNTPGEPPLGAPAGHPVAVPSGRAGPQQAPQHLWRASPTGNPTAATTAGMAARNGSDVNHSNNNSNPAAYDAAAAAASDSDDGSSASSGATECVGVLFPEVAADAALPPRAESASLSPPAAAHPHGVGGSRPRALGQRVPSTSGGALSLASDTCSLPPPRGTEGYWTDNTPQCRAFRSWACNLGDVDRRVVIRHAKATLAPLITSGMISRANGKALLLQTVGKWMAQTTSWGDADKQLLEAMLYAASGVVDVRDCSPPSTAPPPPSSRRTSMASDAAQKPAAAGGGEGDGGGNAVSASSRRVLPCQVEAVTPPPAPEDRARFAVGAKVLVDGFGVGIITRCSHDPVPRVDVALDSGVATTVHGFGMLKLIKPRPSRGARTIRP